MVASWVIGKRASSGFCSFEGNLERAEAAAVHVPDGEIEIILALAEVDALVEWEGDLRRLVERGLIYVKADAGGEAGDGCAVLIERKGSNFKLEMLFSIHRSRRELCQWQEVMDGIRNGSFGGPSHIRRVRDFGRPAGGLHGGNNLGLEDEWEAAEIGLDNGLVSGRNPHLVATFAVGFGMLFTLVGTFTYITFYLADAPFHLSTEALSYLFAIYLIGLLVTPAGGVLVTRIGLRAGVALAVSACLAGVLVTLSHSLWIVILLGLGLVCSGVFMAQTTANTFLRVAAPAGGRASAAGLYICCYYIGGTVGGVVPAYVWTLGKWPACVALIAGVLVVTLVVALVGWKMPGSQRVSETAA